MLMSQRPWPHSCTLDAATSNSPTVHIHYDCTSAAGIAGGTIRSPAKDQRHYNKRCWLISHSPEAFQVGPIFTAETHLPILLKAAVQA